MQDVDVKNQVHSVPVYWRKRLTVKSNPCRIKKNGKAVKKSLVHLVKHENTKKQKKDSIILISCHFDGTDVVKTSLRKHKQAVGNS